MAKSKESVQGPVAIVGLACRLPGGNNTPQQLWDFLEAGGIASRDVPKTRFHFGGHYDGSLRPKTSRQPGGMFLGAGVDLADFDAGFFEVGAAEAVAMDPNQRQMLEVVFEGLENAGLPLERLDGQPVGCFVGSYAVDYADMHNRDPEDRPSNNAIGVARTVLANRLSHFLNIKGPSVTVDTACSGSLQGLDLACRYLQAGDINAAIVASSNLYMSPEHVIDTGSFGGAHSPTGLCHTFDVSADGYVKAEAVSAVIVKRLEDAVRDGDPIRGVILGTATSSNGRTPGIASPSSSAQAAAIRAAYNRAGIADLNLTTYLECHGTGTQAGDPTEINGIGSIFAESRPGDKPLLIGSIKSNIGHSEPAAGISGLLKAVLAIEHGWIPGTPSFVNPSPKIDFTGNKVRAFRTGIPWPEESPRRASINSFGVGGSNAHVIVEQASAEYQPRHVSSYLSADDDEEEDDLEDVDSRSSDIDAAARPFLLLVSANDATSLQAGIQALGDHLANPRVRVKLADLAYTLSERRSRLWHRAFTTTASTEFVEHAESWTAGKKSGQDCRIGFVFTGQGAQWPQMGKDLLLYFPSLVRDVLDELDRVLQSLREPPKWTLLQELTEPRTPDHLRQPEFSQPLVTALQLCILAVLETWGIKPSSVVGHSSGEIAAAYSAGRLDRASAIIAAFHRGRAALNRKSQVEKDVGMLAVGLGADTVSTEFLDKYAGEAWIACFNSPNSVTISGKSSALDALKEDISTAGHFARRLQVDLAYHSELMDAIGEEYEKLLVAEPAFDNRPSPAALADEEDGVAMYSSVTAGRLVAGATTDAEYWRANMISPVRFDEALQTMLGAPRPPNYLIEIGPSGALAGPIAQLLKSLPQQVGGHVTYASSWKRGADAGKAIFDLAGRLWVSGFAVNTAAVNQYDGTEHTIVDLPNYRWSHSVKYWHENAASKDWRFRKYPVHDLLGSKILGVPWTAPIWRSYLNVSNVPYLLDHRLGGHAIMPGAGFLTMAVEAIYQKHCAVSPQEEVASLARNDLCYRFRNVRFNRALVLEEGKEAVVTFSLAIVLGDKHWHEFRIASTEGEIASEHCIGLVRIQDAVEERIPTEDALPLQSAQPARLWYKVEREAGADFGPTFQKMLEIEAVPGQRHCRTLLSLEPAASAHSKQSYYPVHPAALDGVVQTPYIPNALCDRTKVKQLMIPNIIDDFIINKVPSQLRKGLAKSTAVYSGRGRPDSGKSWLANATVYDAETGQLAVKITGMTYAKLDEAPRPDPHTFHAAVWKPDVTLLARDQLTFLDQGEDDDEDKETQKPASTVLDLVAHKKPGLSVLEIGLDDPLEGPGSADTWTSLWLSGQGDTLSTRAAYARYVFGTTSAGTLVNFGAHTKGEERISSYLINPENVASRLGDTTPHTSFDLVVVRTSDNVDSALVNQAWKDLKPFLAKDACRLLVRERKRAVSDADTSPSSPASSEQPASPMTSEEWSDAGSKDIVVDKSSTGSSGGDGDEAPLLALSIDPRATSSVYVGLPSSLSSAPGTAKGDRKLIVARLAKSTPSLGTTLRNALETSGWAIQTLDANASSLPASQSKSVVLVLDELHRPVLAQADEIQWHAIKCLIGSGKPLLWVTKGAQGNRVTDPNQALVHGLFRVAREEDPRVKVHTLDVQSGTSPATTWAIDTVLDLVGRDSEQDDGAASAAETEYMERDGVLHVQRLVPDAPLNAFRRAEEEGLAPVARPFHGTDVQVQLRAERLGTLQSLTWCETGVDRDAPLAAGTIQVEVMAIGVNFKDVAITMGIVPDNEYNLGFECAGVVTRLAPGVTEFEVGDRVCMLKGGSYANRVTVTVERCHRIPDAMSFEEAATIPSVYLCCLYALYHLGNLQEHQSVLIHSATGGVGIACIELAKCKNAEIFVTVGTEEKRQFLETNYGIPRSHMFSSRNTKFADEIRKTTGGRGVDVIVNSLVGELLDASWRLVADGGNMVEIGKRDIVDRNTLAMEPFDRNCSFRAVDFSYLPHINEPLIKRLFDELFVLIDGGRVKPIHPITTFGFDAVIDALSYIRSGRHLGKIVVTNGEKKDVNLPIRPAVRRLRLRSDVSYLIVGGLKGACGTLAIHMAEHGARHIMVCSRSGLTDSTSARVIASCQLYGCQVIEAKCDVGNWDAVLQTFKTASPPVGGIIQGAMVLRDKPLETMSIEDYHGAIHAKVQGTWNLHRAAQETSSHPLDFFTMLSSVSGVVGNKGQANYAAANSFLDGFASYRRSLGLAANTVDLGLIEDVGYVAEQETTNLEKRFDKRMWTPINEAVLRKILTYSVLQQEHGGSINRASAAQMITGIGFPLPKDGSESLAREPRFSYLFHGYADNGAGGAIRSGENGGESGGDQTEQAIQQFKVLHSSGAADAAKLTAACVSLAATQFSRILRLETEPEPGRPLVAYGLDSLAAVELRNWVRIKLGIELTTLDITSAPSLIALCEKMVAKLLGSSQ